MDGTPAERVVALDLIRGIAVLGILAINIAGFAGPPAAILSPDLPNPGTFADASAFAATFVLFEGKMRALFAILFGASLVLYVERVDARGGHGDAAQMRRLGWLALFGLLHFYLLWWGDILFLLAICGMAALLARELPVKTLAISALAIFAIWHLAGMAMTYPDIRAGEHVRLGTASPAERDALGAYLEAAARNARTEMAVLRGSFLSLAHFRLTEQAFWPVNVLFTAGVEIVSLMLLGMVLYRTGFFTGGWPACRLARTAWIGTGLGLALTAMLLAWAWPRRFPLRAMDAAFLYWAAIPHLLMAVGYAAILVLLAPRVAASAIGRSLVAAGRMAFSNYIGTSLVMTFVFYGWGLGLGGRFGHAPLMVFVVGAWAAMLVWSKAWLARYRRGPLEWLWRSLCERQWLANAR